MTTTLGRALVIEAWYDKIGTKVPSCVYENPLSKRYIDRLVEYFIPCLFRSVQVISFWHRMTELGNEYATLKGVSFVSAFLQPILTKDEKEVFKKEIQKCATAGNDGLTSVDKMYFDFSKIWFNAVLTKLQDGKCLQNVRDHKHVIESGHRGTALNLLYLTSVRGFVTLDSNFAVPVMSSLQEGYTDIESGVLSYTRRQLIVKSIGT